MYKRQGYDLQNALRTELIKRGIYKPVSTILTQVTVDPYDESSYTPLKAVSYTHLNFVYEKQGAKHKKVMNYNTALPKNEVFTWDDVKVFIAGQYILMHSVIYRTELLRDCGLELPMHTFYVDNIFVYEPLPHVRKMYYLDVNFYRYFICLLYTSLWWISFCARAACSAPTRKWWSASWTPMTLRESAVSRSFLRIPQYFIKV